METCAGCGAVADDKHPFVGIGWVLDGGAKEVTAAHPVREEITAAHPVCEECWQNPSHRTHRLKMTFFKVEEALKAIAIIEYDRIMSYLERGKKGA